MTVDRRDHRVQVFAAGLHIEMVFEGQAAPLASTIRTLWRDSLVNEPTHRPDLRVQVVHRGENAPPLDDESKALTINSTEPEASYRISGDVTSRVLRKLVGEKLLLHAATVAVESIGTVVLSGASGAGKSTAAVTLAQLGSYMTDELTVLDPHTFHPIPFAKPISLVKSTKETGRRIKEDVALASLGIVRTPDHKVHAPDHLVLVNRNPECSAPHVEHVDLAEAIVALVGQSSSLWKLDQPLSVLVNFIASLKGAWRATYSEVADLPGALKKAIAESPVGGLQEDKSDEYALISPSDVSTREAKPGEYFLAPFAEALWCGNTLLVLSTSDSPSLVKLQGISALLWEVLAEAGPGTNDALVRDIVAIAGDHPDAVQRVKEALAAGCRENVFLKATKA